VLDGLVDVESDEGVDVEGYSDDVGMAVAAAALTRDELSLVVADDKVLFPSLYSLK
jgi:hypothetical protein